MALSVKLKSTLSKSARQDDFGNTINGIDCVQCKKTFTKDTDQLLNCDYCEGWYCTKCLSMSKTDYGHHNHTSDTAMWFCFTCKVKVLVNIKENKTIEEKCKESLKIYEDRIKDLELKLNQKCDLSEVKRLVELEVEKNIQRFDTKIEEKLQTSDIDKAIEDKINLTQNKLKSYADALDVKVSTVNNIAEETMSSNNTIIEQTVKKINEQNEYNERLNNIIIYNLEESTSILKSEITQYDETLAHKLLKVVLPTAKPSEAFSNMPIRLGSRRVVGKIKPLKIKFSHIDYKQAFMSNLPNIANCDNDTIKKCFINHDLNDEERTAEKLLVDEMKTLSAQETGNFLYRIRGPPHSRKVVKIPKLQK